MIIILQQLFLRWILHFERLSIVTNTRLLQPSLMEKYPGLYQYNYVSMLCHVSPVNQACENVK